MDLSLISFTSQASLPMPGSRFMKSLGLIALIKESLKKTIGLLKDVGIDGRRIVVYCLYG